MGRKAVIVGVGQERRNPKFDGPWDPHEPAQMMETTMRRALADLADQTGQAGLVQQLLNEVQLIACVDPLAHGYNDLGTVMKDRLGVGAHVDTLMVPPGGNSPGDLLNRIMERMAEGDLQVAFLSGAECVYSRRRARKEDVELPWTPSEGRRDFEKGQRPLTNDLERRHGLVAPIQCYPLYENALRAKANRSIADHQQFLGEFMARNAAIAAFNEYAWFPFAQSSEQIASVGPDNRMVCFPYPKRMNSIMEVDLAASAIIVSEEAADRLGIPMVARVTVLGGGGAVDGWTPTEREDFTTSPAIRAASQAALEHSALTIDDIDLFDLYSCFPSAVEMALDALGVATDDPRGVTVTGGLAYAGGPGNNYTMHGLAAMVRRLRDQNDPATTALISALGNTATKHALNVLSTDPTRIAAASGRATPKIAVSIEPPPLVDQRSGEAAVETYTVAYDRNGDPERSIFILRFADGARTVANGTCDAYEIEAITATEGIGRFGTVRASEGASDTNHFELAR